MLYSYAIRAASFLNCQQQQKAKSGALNLFSCGDIWKKAHLHNKMGYADISCLNESQQFKEPNTYFSIMVHWYYTIKLSGFFFKKNNNGVEALS